MSRSAPEMDWKHSADYVDAVLLSGLRARYKYIAIAAAMHADADGWVEIDPRRFSHFAGCKPNYIPAIVETLDDGGWMSREEGGWARLVFAGR